MWPFGSHLTSGTLCGEPGFLKLQVTTCVLMLSGHALERPDRVP